MPHCPAPPFAHSSGPRSAKLAFVAEAWGEQEDMVGRPLVGNAGQEFTRLCQEAGIDRRECFLTNTLAMRPPGNSIPALCGSRLEVGADYSRPPISQGKYLRPEYLGELDRLKEELCTVAPHLVVALGGTALWALANTAAIGTLRGTVLQGHLTPSKVLPTYHPSYLFKVWSHRPIVLSDLMKARRESAFPEIRRPRREILVQPSRKEVHERLMELTISGRLISVDVETYAGQITMLGFAQDRDRAIVIDFCNKHGASYWSEDEEVDVRTEINLLLASQIPKVCQNGMYDIQYLLAEGYTLRNFREDTMLLHHSHYPEMQKGLGFLGSIYSQEPAWKLMRGKGEEFKRDE
jgi:uracil-DNA glycosylase